MPILLPHRELYLPKHINGTGLPSSISNGHGLTLTGAKKATTVDGVRCTTEANNIINLGNLYSGSAKFWLSFRFRTHTSFSSMSGNKFIFGRDGAGRVTRASFEDPTAQFSWENYYSAVSHFCKSAETSWVAGTWYHVVLSLSDVNGMRLRVNGGTAVTNPSATGAVASGGGITAMLLNDYGLDANGQFNMDFDDISAGNFDLTAAQEVDLYNGVKPSTVVNYWPCDEGYGTTLTDRGSGGNNATLQSGVKWAKGQVLAPVLSLDGLNDYAASSSGVNIKEPWTFVWVSKMKSTFTGLSANQKQAQWRIDGNNELRWEYDQATDTLRLVTTGSGVSTILTCTIHPVIGDYWIVVCTLDVSGNSKIFINGSLNNSGTGTGPISASPATAYIGSSYAASQFDGSALLFCSFISSALSQKQIVSLTRQLKSYFNLPTVVQ